MNAIRTKIHVAKLTAVQSPEYVRYERQLRSGKTIERIVLVAVYALAAVAIYYLVTWIFWGKLF